MSYVKIDLVTGHTLLKGVT